MNRRTFLATTLAATLALPAAAFVDYTNDDPISAALAEGKTVFVDYAADWCGTCRRQERVIGALRGENPAYDENIVFIRVDWDDFGRAPVTTSRNIPRRSTLLVLKGNKEIGRIVAGTSETDIKKLLDRALAAATGA